MDAIKDLAYGVVATAPSPATSGTSLTLQSGQGANFPVPPFDVLLWPSGVTPVKTNAEIGRCTAIATDTLTITRAQYGTTAQTVAIGFQVGQPIDAQLLTSYPTVFNVKAPQYGATGNGTTDDTTAVQAAITAAQVAGGIVFFPPGTYLISGQLTPIPYGSSCPYIRFTGEGGYANGQWTTGEVGATVLKLTYATGPAKILSLGVGLFEMDHLSVVSSGADNNQFILTTNTTINIHDNYFSGNPANSGVTCQQDVIQCGGTNAIITNVALTSNVATITAANDFIAGQSITITGLTTTALNGTWTVASAGATSFTFAFTHANITSVADNGMAGNPNVGSANNAAFQGYGSVIKNNFFDKIRRAVYGGTDANGIVVAENTISLTCGTNLTGGAAFEWVGYSDPSNDDYGNILRDNLIEMQFYVYASAWTNCVKNVIAHNGCYDHGTGTLASHRFNNAAYLNLVIDGASDETIPVMSSFYTGAQTLISAGDTTPSVYPYGITVGGAGGTGGLNVVEIANGRQGTAVLTGTSAKVIANTSITANSRIFLTIQTPGGTPASPYVFARTAGTSFSIKSTGASDTSTVAYFITEPGSTTI